MWAHKGRKSEAQSLDDLEKGSKEKARVENRLNGNYSRVEGESARG
jgi:hypothetical protein